VGGGGVGACVPVVAALSCVVALRNCAARLRCVALCVWVCACCSRASCVWAGVARDVAGCDCGVRVILIGNYHI
jgi:hypothetical protein